MPASDNSHLWCVILAGGVGSRFWPASTPAVPKQLLPLGSDQPLIRDTVDRIVPLVPPERLRILAGAHLAEPLLSVLPEFGSDNLLVEPRAAGTAPVLAWAAAELERQDPEAVMISLHADHVIQPAEAFRDLLAEAASLAVKHRRLFTIGAVPSRPETGYGYIRQGEPLADGGFQVAEFVEKPNRETAERYVESSDFLWNTGLFVWRAADLLDQLLQWTPEFAEAIPLARAGDVEGFFRTVPRLSIDEGLLERSDRVGVVAATFDWDDVGAWDALFRTRTPDVDGNVGVGDVYPVDCQRVALYSSHGPVVAFGVEDLVVVRTAEVTFVTRPDLAPELKKLLARLPGKLSG